MRREMGGLEKGKRLLVSDSSGAEGLPRLQWFCTRQQRVERITDAVSGLPPVEEMDTSNMLAQSLVRRGGEGARAQGFPPHGSSILPTHESYMTLFFQNLPSSLWKDTAQISG